jgi:hypothetical protein
VTVVGQVVTVAGEDRRLVLDPADSAVDFDPETVRVLIRPLCIYR